MKVLFIIGQHWKQPKCPAEYYLAIQKNELLIYLWVSLKIFVEKKKADTRVHTASFKNMQN